jgi:hypothetical protein
MARMYPLFLVFFTAAVWMMLRAARGRGGTLTRVAAVLLAVPAVFTHQLGAAMGLVFLVPLLLPRDRRPPVVWSLAGIAVAGASFAALKLLSRSLNAGPAVPEYIGGRPKALVLPFIGGIELNKARLILGEVWAASPLVAVVALALLAAVAFLLLRHLSRDGVGRPALAVAGLFVLALSVNQVVLAALAAIVAIKLGARDPRDGVRLALPFAAAGAVAVAVHLAASLLALGVQEVAGRMFLRTFLALPRPWWKLVVAHFPLMALVTGIGCAAFLLLSLKKGEDQGRFLLVGAFAVPLLLMGILPAPYFRVHYVYYLNPLFALLFAMTLAAAAGWLSARLLPPGGVPLAAGRWTLRAGALTAILVAAGVVLLSEQFDPGQARAMSRRGYGATAGLVKDPNLTATFYYDAKTPALYIRERRGPGDLVIARDAVNLYPYLGMSDYLLRGPTYSGMAVQDGVRVDKNLGIPVLSDAASLEAVLRDNVGPRVWIVSSDGGEDGPDVNLPDDLLALLRRLDVHRVYSAEDGVSFVLRVDPDASAPAPG